MATSELTEQLLKLADSPPTGLGNHERKQFMAACEKAKLALEDPLEATVRFMLGGVESIALRLAVDMKLLDLGIASKGPITADQLASGSGADIFLVVRIMRMLVAMGLFKQIEQHTYIANPLAGIWVTGSPLREAVIHIATQLPPITLLPEYLEQRGYKNPSDAEDGPWQFTFQNNKNFFDWLDTKPAIQSAFNTTMRIQRENRGEEWFQFYPVQEKLNVQDPSAILLVDIGGNVGHDLINFRNRFPDLPGKLIFEDIPVIVDSARDLPDGIEGIGHDFFAPQPPVVSNAKAYYLRNVLHDWPDKQAKLILENIRPVMTKDSILLINENALPDDNVALYQAELDMIMMAVFASLDRTAAQFEELLDSAGFKLVKVWKPEDYGPGSGTLFEAVLKE